MVALAKSSSAVKIPVQDDNFILPSKYAIRAALNAIYDANDIRGTDKHWLWKFTNPVANGRLSLDELASDLETGPLSQCTLSAQRKDCRRNGKPSLQYTMTKLLPDSFREYRPESGWGGTLDMAVVRKDEIFARKDYLEERSCVSGLSVCKHALERYYEREQISHDRIHRRILSDVADLDRMLVFAVASNLFCFGDAFDPDAVTALPLGDGLLMVRNTILVVEGGWRPSLRLVRKKRKFFKTPTAFDPYRSLPGLTIDGMLSEGFLMSMGVTYVSFNMLRLEQMAYAEMFKAEAAKHDLAALGASMGRTWLSHEARPERPSIEVNPYLPYLLSQTVNRGRPWPLWYCIGWNKAGDPKAA